MTQNTTGGATPPNAASLATNRVDLSLNTPMVLGVFGPENGLSALVRLPGGKTRTLQTGERLNGKRVVRIDTDGVVLAQGGREERLALP